jgi:hypothetical protein
LIGAVPDSAGDESYLRVRLNTIVGQIAGITNKIPIQWIYLLICLNLPHAALTLPASLTPMYELIYAETNGIPQYRKKALNP